MFVVGPVLIIPQLHLQPTPASDVSRWLSSLGVLSADQQRNF